MNLSQITKEYVNTPYSEVNCLELMKELSITIGLAFPTDEDIESLSFNKNKLSIRNHLEYYRSNPIKAQALMVKLFLSYYKRVEIPVLGDIIFIKTKTDNRLNLWPSIYVGRGVAVSSFIDQGVVLFRYQIIGKTFLILRLKDKAK